MTHDRRQLYGVDAVTDLCQHLYSLCQRQHTGYEINFLSTVSNVTDLAKVSRYCVEWKEQNGFAIYATLCYVILAS